jgi:hypothetical protein
MILSPGSKGWISKYHQLILSDDLIVSVTRLPSVSTEHFIYITLAQSGIIVGLANELIFAKNIDSSLWTNEEKLTLLLFESHLFLFVIHGGNPKTEFTQFVSSLLDFYGKHNASSVTKFMNYFLRSHDDLTLESILAKRTDISLRLTDQALWVNYVSNTFVFLDVILFWGFIQTKKQLAISSYEELALDVLKVIVVSAYSDGIIQKKEKMMFDIFLASANLSDQKRKEAITFYKHKLKLSDISDLSSRVWIFRRYLLDISVLTVYSKNESLFEEKKFLMSLCDLFHFSKIDLSHSIGYTEQFVINNDSKLPFLKDASSASFLYENVSKRWIKILGRNKDKLANELKQSKELIVLIKKSTSEELSKEEKEKVRTQFLDIVKTIPSLAIFMLPGGAFVLPIVLKVIPKLVPSAFRDNELEILQDEK